MVADVEPLPPPAPADTYIPLRSCVTTYDVGKTNGIINHEYQRWDRVMKWGEVLNLVIGVGVISLGLHLLLYSGAYSWKQRMYVQFVSSPVKEIFGVGCILWGLSLIYLVVKAYVKQKKTKKH